VLRKVGFELFSRQLIILARYLAQYICVIFQRLSDTFRKITQRCCHQPLLALHNGRISRICILTPLALLPLSEAANIMRLREAIVEREFNILSHNSGIVR